MEVRIIQRDSQSWNIKDVEWNGIYTYGNSGCRGTTIYFQNTPNRTELYFLPQYFDDHNIIRTWEMIKTECNDAYDKIISYTKSDSLDEFLEFLTKKPNLNKTKDLWQLSSFHAFYYNNAAEMLKVDSSLNYYQNLNSLFEHDRICCIYDETHIGNTLYWQMLCSNEFEDILKELQQVNIYAKENGVTFEWI